MVEKHRTSNDVLYSITVGKRLHGEQK